MSMSENNTSIAKALINITFSGDDIIQSLHKDMIIQLMHNYGESMAMKMRRDIMDELNGKIDSTILFSLTKIPIQIL